jgi:hypothetical protein
MNKMPPQNIAAVGCFGRRTNNVEGQCKLLIENARPTSPRGTENGSGSSKVSMHDVYHAGQIQLLRKLMGKP